MPYLSILLSCLMMITLLSSCATLHSQDMDTEELPFAEIPAAPNEFNEFTTAARLIDALGFRYRWATEGLTEEDLIYRVSEDSRSMGETLNHLYSLTRTTLNSITATPNVRGAQEVEMTWEEKRMATLENLKKASDMLHGAHDLDMATMKIIFERDGQTSDFPFWNSINGPIADALTHVGQIVSWRRANGNPQPPGVNVFTGKKF